MCRACSTNGAKLNIGYMLGILYFSILLHLCTFIVFSFSVYNATKLITLIHI
jgi:hypothetical protein